MCPRPICHAYVSIIQCDDPDGSAESVSVEFKQNCRGPSIQPWTAYSRRSALVRNWAPTVDEVHDCIANCKLAGSQWHPYWRELFREFESLALLAKSSALQLPEISLSPGTHVIQTSYEFTISLRCLRQSYTVLDFVTLESIALMVAWLSESMVIFRL